MIKIGCISQIKLSDSDECWWIVRSPDEIPDNVREKLVSDLSPSPQLFREYRRAVQEAVFDEKYFQNIYVKRFLQELIYNRQAIDILYSLCKISRERNIILGCYCKNESLCHRSIVAGILLGMGATIETKPEYISYYDLFKEMKEGV